MAETLAQLLAKRQELDNKISALQTEARVEAISTIRDLMAEYGLTAVDIIGRQALPKTGTIGMKPVKVKYRDAQGNTWTGRGLKPKWLSSAIASGKSPEDFAV